MISFTGMPESVWTWVDHNDRGFGYSAALSARRFRLDARSKGAEAIPMVTTACVAKMFSVSTQTAAAMCDGINDSISALYAENLMSWTAVLTIA